MPIDKQIKILESLLLPQSHLAYELDVCGNYEISRTHHLLCVEVIDKIQHLRKLLPAAPFSFDMNQNHLLNS